MENRCERMGVVATTADVLEAQQKEQKVGISSCFIEKLPGHVCCLLFYTFLWGVLSDISWLTGIYDDLLF